MSAPKKGRDAVGQRRRRRASGFRWTRLTTVGVREDVVDGIPDLRKGVEVVVFKVVVAIKFVLEDARRGGREKEGMNEDQQICFRSMLKIE